MARHSKWLTAYIVNLYLIYLVLFIGNIISTPFDNIILAWFITLASTLITGGGSVMSVIISIIKGRFDSENSLKIVTRAKLALIPIYTINFLFALAAILVSGTPWTFWLVSFVPLFFIFACSILFTMSVHSVVAIISLRKDGIIKNKRFVLHFLLQFVFVLDILSCIFLYVKKYKPHYGKLKTAFVTSLPIVIPVAIVLIGLLSDYYQLSKEIAEYPLNYAVEQGDVKRVKRVLKNGADPNEIHIRTGNPALLTVCDKGQSKYEVHDVEIIKLLLEYGADPNYINFDDDRYYNLLSPLNVVLRSHHADYVLEIVALLIEYDVDVNLEARGGTPLQVYCRTYSKPAEILKLLLENGADPNKHSDYYKGLNASTGHFEITKQTPLIVFCNSYYAEDLEVVRLLIEYGANVNHKDSEGRTALFYATHSYGSRNFGNKLANLLKEHGAR